MADTEETLVRAKSGDSAAFGALVREHQAMVFSSAYHFFRNTAWAEEVAQDIFLDLYRNLDSIESLAHLRAWLRRSAVNRCIDRSRKRAYRAEVPLSSVGEAPSHDMRGDLFVSNLLRQEIALLPEMQRAVVILRYQEELEPSEIAALLNLPVNTVKSRLHRGLETLRSKFTLNKRQMV